MKSPPVLVSLLLLLSALALPAESVQAGLRYKKSVNWSSITSAIDACNITNIYVRISDDQGMLYEHGKGTTTSSSLMNVASASKWFSSTIIHDLIDQGKLAITDNPQKYFDFWPSTGPYSQITLAHALSFTTGYADDAPCIDDGNANEWACLLSIKNNQTLVYTPGSTFYYGSTHMYIAKMMAVNATGLSWATIVTNFKSKHGLATLTKYYSPSLNNPNLAGGLSTTAEDYDTILRKIYLKTVVQPSTIDVMETDQLMGATIAYSPAAASGNEWHYALGNWVECPSILFNNTLCNQQLHVRSSCGLFGFYPYLDRGLQYYMVFATISSNFVKSFSLVQQVTGIITASPSASTSSTTTNAASATPTVTGTSPPAQSSTGPHLQISAFVTLLLSLTLLLVFSS